MHRSDGAERAARRARGLAGGGGSDYVRADGDAREVVKAPILEQRSLAWSTSMAPAAAAFCCKRTSYTSGPTWHAPAVQVPGERSVVLAHSVHVVRAQHLMFSSRPSLSQ